MHCIICNKKMTSGYVIHLLNGDVNLCNLCGNLYHYSSLFKNTIAKLTPSQKRRIDKIKKGEKEACVYQLQSKEEDDSLNREVEKLTKKEK